MPSPFENHDWVDLSHTLEEGIPAWPTHARFSSTLYESQTLGDVATHNGLTISEHSGTHMDAPLHFVPEGTAHYGADGIPLERLVGRAATIDATALGPDEPLLGPERIRAWEEEHGPLEPGDRVLVRYGWAERWATGREGRRFLEHWPGLSGEAAEYLVEKGVALVGCDTLAVDAAGSEENPAHHVLLGNEVYVVENLKNLEVLPPFCLFLALPLKIKDGSGSPVRAVALVPR